MSNDFVTHRRLENIHSAMYILPMVYNRDHYITFQWFRLACNELTEISPSVWASHPSRRPLLCLMGWAIVASSTLSHGSAIAASPNISAVCHSSFLAQPVGTPRLASTTYYARSYPYKLSWLYCFHGWSFHKPVLRFGYDNRPQASSIALD
jgi:hypothetical protein